MEEVTLGPLRASKLDQYYTWRNCPSIYKWCRQFEPLTEVAHLKWFEGLQNRQDVRMYEVQAYEAPVGVCGLTSIDMINRRAEFSLYIGPEHQGKGIGFKALKLLCARGFYNLNLNSIFGESFAGNPAMEMFKGVGFQFEGVRREFYYRDGRYVDAHLFSILKWEFDEKWNVPLLL